jgi:hypothetical protein
LLWPTSAKTSSRSVTAPSTDAASTLGTKGAGET